MDNQYQITKETNPVIGSMSFARLMRNVYGWMTAGLAMTALTALIVANSPSLLATIYSSPVVLFGIIIAELVMVGMLSARIDRMSFLMAGLIFGAYSVVNGLTMSVIFLAYNMDVIVQTFAITAGVFGAMSLLGFFVKKDLSAIGRVLYMALIGLIIATVVNLFAHNTGLAMVINYGGVLVFVGLTAYDTQKIKKMMIACDGDESMSGKLAVLGSLTLYLDFVNLFLYILRFVGGRK